MNATPLAAAKRASSEYLPEVGRSVERRLARATSPHVLRRGAPVQHRLTLEEAMPELRALRELLEETLAALRAIYLEQRQAIGQKMQEPGAPVEELRALTLPGAPWVTALDQTRQLIRESFLEIAGAYLRAHASRQ
jgi:hypothetical protein